MNQKRAFIIFNSTLAVIGLLCLYYLFSTAYSTPPEIGEAGRWVEYLNKPGQVSMSPQVGASGAEGMDLIDLAQPKNIMRALYTMPPTTTPTPKPTQTPVPLTVVINSWTLVSMDETTVTVLDQKSGQELELILNGATQPVEFQGQTYDVKLIGIDLEADRPAAKFNAGGSSADKQLQ